MAKTKTTRTRTKAAGAAKVQPVATAAPVAVPAVVEPPGLRTHPAWSPLDRCPRPAGELSRTAELCRGVTYTISYSTGPLVFRYGKPVPINDSEFARLGKAIDKIDFQDPDRAACTVRSIRKFRFADAATGEAIELEPIPDVEGGPHAMSAGDRAEFDRKFEGQQFTAR